MAIFGAVIILKLGLDQDSFVTDLFSNGCKNRQQCSFLLIGEIGRRFWILNDSVRISGISEHMIDIIAEARVVNETRWEPVFINKCVDLLLIELNIKGA